MACCFLWFALAVLFCFCVVCLWTAFGDLSPIIVCLFSYKFTRLRNVSFLLRHWHPSLSCPVLQNCFLQEISNDCPIPIHTSYRVQTPPFSYTLASHDNLLNNFFAVGLLSCNLDGLTVYPPEADGVFLMLVPLSVGQHTIHVFAVVGPLAHPHSEKDITYQITVTP